MSIYKTDEEVEKLLNHQNNGLVKIKIIGSGNHGKQSKDHKREGDQRRDLETKVTAGTLASLIGNGATAELMDLKPNQISQYSNGRNSNNEVKAEIVNGIAKKLSKISEKALARVEKLVDNFDDDRMEELKASEIPSAAEKLMSIIEKASTHSDSDSSKASRPQIIIHAPRQLNVTQYITKEV